MSERVRVKEIEYEQECVRDCYEREIAVRERDCCERESD